MTCIYAYLLSAHVGRLFPFRAHCRLLLIRRWQRGLFKRAHAGYYPSPDGGGLLLFPCGRRVILSGRGGGVVLDGRIRVLSFGARGQVVSYRRWQRGLFKRAHAGYYPSPDGGGISLSERGGGVILSGRSAGFL